jgi:nucleoside-diphosphate-sugar epimerase
VTRHGVKLYGADNLVSIGKAQRDLGYQPQMDLNEGVKHAATRYLEERELEEGT